MFQLTNVIETEYFKREILCKYTKNKFKTTKKKKFIY
jgi:hypothetical protein